MTTTTEAPRLELDIPPHIARAMCVILDRKPRPLLDRVALRVVGGVGTWEATDGRTLLFIREHDQHRQQPKPDGVWLLDRASVIRAGKMPQRWRTGQECRVSLTLLGPPDRAGVTPWPDCDALLADYRIATEGPPRQGFDAHLLALPSAVSTALGRGKRTVKWAMEHLRGMGSASASRYDPIRLDLHNADGLDVLLLIMPCRLE